MRNQVDYAEQLDRARIKLQFFSLECVMFLWGEGGGHFWVFWFVSNGVYLEKVGFL